MTNQIAYCIFISMGWIYWITNVKYSNPLPPQPDPSAMEIHAYPSKNHPKTVKNSNSPLTYKPDAYFFGSPPTTNSVLSSGSFYKIRITSSGLYKLDYSFFEDKMKVNADVLNPKNIQLFGQRGGTLAEAISEPRIDDLIEIPIYFEGQEDNKFNSNDFLIFYGEGASYWKFDENEKVNHFFTNPFDRYNYYYIKIDGEKGARITKVPGFEGSDFTITEYYHPIRYEDDRVNLLANFQSTLGSGRDWYGDLFRDGRMKDYSEHFQFKNKIPGKNLRVYARFAGRSDQSSNYQIIVNGKKFTAFIPGTRTYDVEATYAHVRPISAEMTTPTGEISVQCNYPNNGSTTEGYLDYIEIHAPTKLIYESTPLFFSYYDSEQTSIKEYQIDHFPTSGKVWDISDPTSPRELTTKMVSNQQVAFQDDTPEPASYVAFEPQAFSNHPEVIGLIPNQNLHGLQRADLIIIYHPDFKDATDRLAKHRKDYSNLTVKTINILDIYNEFSSGKTDPTAIRDFVKMIYDRDPQFKYLLLMGDASYDYRNIDDELADQLFIPPYETKSSLEPLSSFPTDDFFALLSPNEGGNLRGALDIAVGRLPVQTPEQADLVVSKIIRYDNNGQMHGDWRLKVALVADDEENGIFVTQQEGIEEDNLLQYNNLNIEKIYFDAFRQERTPGGEFFPDANAAINNSFFRGALVMSYLGHGGPTGWAQERVLQIQDINGWNNLNNLPLLITATCSFTSYDDPASNSGGELCLLNGNGGVIALFSTVRSVYLSSNYRLTQAVFSELFKKENGIYPSIGEIMLAAKNKNSADTLNVNSRKFSLFGDPSMKLAYPNQYQVVTSKINQIPVDSIPDTLQALQKITISGEIQNELGDLAGGFNGFLYPTLFDKEIVVKTLSQNETSREIPFNVQKNILYKGEVQISKGQFEFSFILPKDINYEYGMGKLSYYATNGAIDAAGAFQNLIIGGTHPLAEADDTGPEISLYMNDENFIDGGITDENPVLLVKLKDDLGINVSGNSIGHDVTAVLDHNSRNTYVLNEYYQTEQNVSSEGKIRFPLYDLKPGMHVIEVKAWDLANNSNQATLTFNVLKKDTPRIKSITNFPNPMRSETQFIFEHNVNKNNLIFYLEVFNTQGQKVSEVQNDFSFSGYRSISTPWDGTDYLNNPLPQGMYFYRISLYAGGDLRQMVTQSKVQKLMIIR